MDELDRAIALELERDARKSDAQIARVLRVSGASVRRRIRTMVEDGVLRVVAFPDPRKLGYETSAMIGIQVQPAKVDDIGSQLAREQRVHWVFLSTGKFDFLIWATFKSYGELADFMKSSLYAMPGVVRTETMLLLREVKVEQSILEDPDGESERIARAREERDGRNKESESEEKPEGLDDCNYNLILELQRDARQTDAAIGRKLGVSDATVRRRVSRLLDHGVIKIAAVMDPPKLGYPVTVSIGLQMDLSKIDHALDMLVAMPRVHYIALTTGMFDIWLWGTFRSPMGLSDFLRSELAKVPGIVKCETMVSLETKKRGRAVLPPNPAVSRKP